MEKGYGHHWIAAMGTAARGRTEQGPGRVISTSMSMSMSTGASTLKLSRLRFWQFPYLDRAVGVHRVRGHVWSGTGHLQCRSVQQVYKLTRSKPRPYSLTLSSPSCLHFSAPPESHINTGTGIGPRATSLILPFHRPRPLQSATGLSLLQLASVSYRFIGPA